MGTLLVILHLALIYISPRFAYEQDNLSKPILAFVGIEIAAGAVYLLISADIHRAKPSKGLLIWVILVGVVSRAAMFASTPVLEDDFYRYLWDGAVTARGANPYSFSPDEVLAADDESSAPASLRQMSGEADEIIWRINHPELRTIYPPVAQAVFALAYRLRPWSLTAWRLTLLGFDIATLGLLALALRKLNLPMLSLAIYWWNPLLIKEAFNSAHMDLVVLPFVLAAVLLAISKREVSAAGALGLAVGAKVWPALLLPMIARSLFSQPKRLIVAIALFTLLSGAIFFPTFRAGLGESSGFTAYGQSWEMNDALFMLILSASKAAVSGFGYESHHGKLLARLLIGVALGALIIWRMRKQPGTGSQLCENCLIIVAALFLLNPAQFPWYFIWLIPFLALRPRRSLLLLTMLLPLYYLRFYFSARGNVKVFDQGIVWLEDAPVWLLLLREWFVARRNQSKSLVEVSA
jgi:hypothetical protein